MEVKREYSELFNTISETIDQLSKIIFTATSCMEILKTAQIKTEEMFLKEADTESEMDCKCSETN